MGKYLDSFNEYGWVSGDITVWDEKWNTETDEFHSTLVGHCLLGHMCRVEGLLNEITWSLSGISDQELAEYPFANALRRAILESYPNVHFEDQRATFVITYWNDADGRTEAEVRDVIKRAEELMGL